MNSKLRVFTAGVVLAAALGVWWLSVGGRRSVPSEDHSPSSGIPTDLKGAASALDELRKTLPALKSEEAVKRILALLESGTDASTGLGFTLQRDGFLAEAPTLRVFLLDYLAQVDRASAADYAEKILADMDSPDEWAVALRNHAAGRDTPAGRAFIEDKMRAMLQHEQWQAQASAGFLEAFDVAVWLGGTNLMPALTTLVRQQDNRAVAHASYLALDRLAFCKEFVRVRACRVQFRWRRVCRQWRYSLCRRRLRRG